MAKKKQTAGDHEQTKQRAEKDNVDKTQFKILGVFTHSKGFTRPVSDPSFSVKVSRNMTENKCFLIF